MYFYIRTVNRCFTFALTDAGGTLKIPPPPPHSVLYLMLQTKTPIAVGKQPNECVFLNLSLNYIACGITSSVSSIEGLIIIVFYRLYSHIHTLKQHYIH